MIESGLFLHKQQFTQNAVQPINSSHQIVLLNPCYFLGCIPLLMHFSFLYNKYKTQKAMSAGVLLLLPTVGLVTSVIMLNMSSECMTSWVFISALYYISLLTGEMQATVLWLCSRCQIREPSLHRISLLNVKLDSVEFVVYWPKYIKLIGSVFAISRAAVMMCGRC